MRKRHIMAIFGTRPEAVKMAPVVAALGRRGHFRVSVTVTAQHREMLDQTLRHFAIRPEHDLNIMRARQSLTHIATGVLQGLDGVFQQDRPDLVLVHGDTLTTFAAAWAAFFQRIPVGHVEAGLRTGDKYSPFPEEMNRRLTGALADLHFAPTDWARQNLLREGVPDSSITVTGNTAIDALLMTARSDYPFRDPAVGALVRQTAGAAGGQKRLFLVDSLHRRENFGPAMREIYQAVRELALSRDDIALLVLLHKNPEAREVALELLGDVPGIQLGEPMDYPDWVNLMARAYVVLSDSGGVQEEAPSLGVPVLLLRDTTERPEAIEAGTVRMVGCDRHRILRETRRLLDDAEAHRAMARAKNPYGDGRASERIADAITAYFERH